MKSFLTILLTAMLLGCGRPKQTLNVLIWTDYIDPKVVSDFEKQFDCKVVFDYFDNDAIVIPKLAAGGVSAYDIVCMGNHIIPALVNQKLLAPLRHENLSNFKNLASDFINLDFDPGNRYSIPYQWVTTGICVRKPPNTVLDESWALIFDPERQPGPFLLVDEMKSSLGAALRYKGYSVNSTNLAELTQARDLLIETKKRSLGFHLGTGSRNQVLTRVATLAMAWGPNAAEDTKLDPDVVFSSLKKVLVLGSTVSGFLPRHHIVNWRNVC